jgi:hypothetical protein
MNTQFFANATIDGLIEDIANEVNDTRRLELWKELQIADAQTFSQLWIHTEGEGIVMRTWVFGYKHNWGNLGYDFFNVYKATPLT